jgi:hypothetical protein
MSIRVAILTVSDGVSAGTRKDEAAGQGQALRQSV